MTKRRKLSPAQRAWCKLYEDETGFDVHTLEDYLTGVIPTFHEAANKACRWYEDHSTDAHFRVTANIPGQWKALDAKLREPR